MLKSRKEKYTAFMLVCIILILLGHYKHGDKPTVEQARVLEKTLTRVEIELTVVEHLTLSAGLLFDCKGQSINHNRELLPQVYETYSILEHMFKKGRIYIDSDTGVGAAYVRRGFAPALMILHPRATDQSDVMFHEGTHSCAPKHRSPNGTYRQLMKPGRENTVAFISLIKKEKDFSYLMSVLFKITALISDVNERDLFMSEIKLGGSDAEATFKKHLVFQQNLPKEAWGDMITLIYWRGYETSNVFPAASELGITREEFRHAIMRSQLYHVRQERIQEELDHLDVKN